MYQILDVAFLLFHTALVLFNLFGWIWPRTRRAHLVTISLTLLSWVALGAFFGFGYCPCTDWHWDVKRALGERELPASYIEYYLERATGLDWNPDVVDAIVVAATGVSFGLSIWLNLRDRHVRR